MADAGMHEDPGPSWPTCPGRGAGPGPQCRGKQAEGFEHCLAHLDPGQLDQVLHRLRPGGDLDASGTPVNAQLLAQILQAVRGDDGRPSFGEVAFTDAHFTEDAGFNGVRFGRSAGFTGAVFSGDTSFIIAEFGQQAAFDGAQFSGNARFGRAVFAWGASFDGAQFAGSSADFDHALFNGRAGFEGTQFSGVMALFSGTQFRQEAWFINAHFRKICHAGLDGAQFTGPAIFAGAQFAWGASFDSAQFAGHALFRGARFAGPGRASFDSAQFRRDAGFYGTQFAGEASFKDAKFENATSVGPFAAGSVSLDGALFARPVVIEAAAASISCRGATWAAGTTMRLRYAAVDLAHATFTMPSFVSGTDQPFQIQPVKSQDPGEPAGKSQGLAEDQARDQAAGDRRGSPDFWMPLLTSLRGTDAANLTVTDADLSTCRFAGALLLDQIRLEGRCIFDHPPAAGHSRWPPPAWRWSSRQCIAEERAWRATTARYAGWSPARSAGPAGVGPERLAGLYRQLRKAQEDAKNEPGAADFYYGEMDMRRMTAAAPAGERAILWLYWLISGYGLRAVRSLAALAILGVLVTTALVGWGLAGSAPAQHLAGIVAGAPGRRDRISATLITTAPGLPPGRERWTAQRARTALEVTLDSVVFRATDQPLTDAGTWVTDAARILGPVLLALALLAVRNRVKR